MTDRGPHPSRRFALLLLAGAVSGISPGLAATTTLITVHKDPNCGCCSGWVKHVERNGFAVRVIETTKLRAVKKRLAIPDELASCHTAEVDGYVVEGHVPASALKSFLVERPNASGLAVAGMPVGAPGMEGRPLDPYEVVLFGPEGQRTYMRFKGDKQI